MTKSKFLIGKILVLPKLSFVFREDYIDMETEKKVGELRGCFIGAIYYIQILTLQLFEKTPIITQFQKLN